MTKTDPFDDFLRRSMTARPEHTPQLDVAAIAIAHAKESARRELQLRHIARLARWQRNITAVAALLVALTIAAGYFLWPTVTSSTTDATTATTSTLDFTTLGLIALFVVIVSLTLTMIMTPERQNFRLALS